MEYCELKEELFHRIQAVIIGIEKDKSSEGTLPDEIIDLRDTIRSVAESIEILSSKFLYITHISLGDFLYSTSIKEAIKDFERVEIDLFKIIRDEFYILLQDWLKFHESELTHVNQQNNSLSNPESYGSSILRLQSKRLSSYIAKIGNLFR